MTPTQSTYGRFDLNIDNNVIKLTGRGPAEGAVPIELSSLLVTLFILTANAGQWLADVIVGGFRESFAQLVCLVVPFVLVAVALRKLERWIQLTLARRFGWRGVLWTGWLGTPIHELSHVVVCLLFQHRVHEVALFKPDLNAGRLGYVAHSYAPRNRWQKLVNFDLGSFFIGIAPLAGGAAVLYGLLWMFFPEVPGEALQGGGMAEAIADGRLSDAVTSFANLSQTVLAGIIRFENVATFRLWIFLYLTLCIGGHMAPSSSDLRGARGGAVLLACMMLIANLVYLMFGGEPGSLMAAAAGVVSPVLAVFLLSAILCAISSVILVAVINIIEFIVRK